MEGNIPWGSYDMRTPVLPMAEINPDGQDRVWEAAPDWQLFNRADQGRIITPDRVIIYDRPILHATELTAKGKLKFLEDLFQRLRLAS